MPDGRKIIRELFSGPDGEPVETPAEAYSIEVWVEDDDGSVERTYLIRQPEGGTP